MYERSADYIGFPFLRCKLVQAYVCCADTSIGTAVHSTYKGTKFARGWLSPCHLPLTLNADADADC